MTAVGTRPSTASPAADAVSAARPAVPVARPPLDVAEVFGGPHGRHPAASRLWRPVVGLLLVAIGFCIAGYAMKAPCRNSSNWQANFQYTHYCYSDVVALYGTEHLSDGQLPYYDQPVEYPVLIGGAMQLAASGVDALAGISPHPATAEERNAWFFDLTAILLTIGAVVVVVATAGAAGRRRAWDAALVVATPAFVLNAFTNWDLLAVACAAGGLWAWARRHPKLAGLLFGLGVCVKFYPFLAVLALLPLCLRSRRMRGWWACAGTTLATVVVVVAPVYLTAGYFTEGGTRTASAWSSWRHGSDLFSALAPHHGVATNAVWWFVEFNGKRTPDWGSLAYGISEVTGAREHGPAGWLVLGGLVLGCLAVALVALGTLLWRRWPGVAAGLAAVSVLVTAWAGVVCISRFRDGVTGFDAAGVNRITGVGSGLLILAVLVVAFAAPRRPRVGQVAFLVLVSFLLLNKVFSPQYVLWLLPLAVLARPQRRAFYAWQWVEVVLIGTLYLTLVHAGSDGTGISPGWYIAVLFVRAAVLIYLAARVVIEIFRPEQDLVRAGGVDDPAAGVLLDAGEPAEPGEPRRLGDVGPVTPARPMPEPSAAEPLPQQL